MHICDDPSYLNVHVGDDAWIRQYLALACLVVEAVDMFDNLTI